MRTDLITAWLIYEWVQENAPEVAEEWSLTVDEQIKGFAQNVAALLPNSRIQLVGQHTLARNLIDRWDLSNVALLSGGTPTPLSPRPDQIHYYTDNNEAVVEEAANAGYNALQVNATNADDLKKLDGATTAFATGLFHFLPDPAVPMVFTALEAAGFHTIVFNHGNRNAEEGGAEIRERYSKMGVNLYPRTGEEVQALVPPGWAIMDAIPQPDALTDDPLIGEHVGDLPNITDVYRVSKV